jgi:hypothetical protein
MQAEVSLLEVMPEDASLSGSLERSALNTSFYGHIGHKDTRKSA